MKTLHYPGNIKALTSLRFVAAIWVVFHHYRDRVDFSSGFENAFFLPGYLAVDFFFILSGFILTHVYMSKIMSGHFDYGSFLKNRLARIYPIHLATLAATIILYGLFLLLNIEPNNPERYNFWDLPSHLFLTHAWGTSSELTFNYPSWSISAEWFAYLCFPITLYLALKARQQPLLVLLVAAFLFVILANVSQIYLNTGIIQLTHNFGILRILPEFTAGVGLYMLGRRIQLSALMTNITLLVSLMGIIGILVLQLSPLLVVPLFALIIFATAELSRNRAAPARFLENRTFMYLGEISYSLYMTHVLVFTVYFNGLDRLLGTDVTSAYSLPIWAFSFVIVLIVAAVGYHIVEVPGRELIRNSKFSPGQKEAGYPKKRG